MAEMHVLVEETLQGGSHPGLMCWGPGGGHHSPHCPSHAHKGVKHCLLPPPSSSRGRRVPARALGQHAWPVSHPPNKPPKSDPTEEDAKTQGGLGVCPQLTRLVGDPVPSPTPGLETTHLAVSAYQGKSCPWTRRTAVLRSAPPQGCFPCSKGVVP